MKTEKTNNNQKHQKSKQIKQNIFRMIHVPSILILIDMKFVSDLFCLFVF